ncbi:MAG: helix-turn-helix domain-containing protein [Acidimicrobiales bacterium]
MTEVRAKLSNALGSVAPDGVETSPRPMRADAQRNHEKILQAAEEVFALDGVMVPIDIVAERAGVGVGTLYRHFPTKESLYEAIVLTRLTGLLATADDYIKDPDAGAALDGFLREFARQAAEKQDLFEALQQAGIDIKAHFAGRVDELVEKIDVLRRRAVDAGAIRSDVETNDILNLVMGTCHAAGHAGVDEAGLQRLVNIVIAGLQPTS